MTFGDAQCLRRADGLGGRGRGLRKASPALEFHRESVARRNGARNARVGVGRAAREYDSNDRCTVSGL